MRAASIALNLLLVPVLITYLGTDQYGVWLTISSLIGWSGLLDLGLGNGLKNAVAQALAENDTEKARSLISTGYLALSAIAIILVGHFIFLDHYIDWISLLNITGISADSFSAVLMVFLVGFSFKLFFGQIVNVAAANQYTSLNDLVNFLVNLTILALVLFIFKNGSLLTISYLYAVIPVLVLIGSSYFLFMRKLKDIRPRFSDAKFEHLGLLMGSGSKFFLIQIAGVIIFSTDNLIISHLLDPSEVTNYQVAFKYFGMATVLFSVICTPLWPAYTNAFHQNDMNWIRSTTQKMVKLWIGLSAGVLLMLFVSQPVYDLWVGDSVQIPFMLSALMATYVIFMSWASIFVTFINSTGKLALQVRFSIAAGIINIPLSVFFVKQFGMGPAGVILATIICLSYGPFVSIIQYKKIVSNTAKGIWAK